MKIRVGILLSWAPSGGGGFQRALSFLRGVQALSGDEYEKVVVYVDDAWKEHLADMDADIVQASLGVFENTHLRRASCLMPGAWRSLSRFFNPVCAAIARSRCDMWVFPSQDLWGFQVKVPSISIIHDIMHRYERRFPEVGERREFERRDNTFARICRHATVVVADSELGKQHVADAYGVDHSRISVLPMVPPDYIFEDGVGVGYDLPEKFLFYPAQFWPHKNHVNLLRAIAILNDRHPDMRLVCTGSHGHEYPRIRDLAQGLGLGDRVLFPGYVDNDSVPTLYRQARAMVMPTFFGPTNIPPLEAQAMGCPVAVSNIYAMPEQLGDGALYFDPDSPESIAQVLDALWRDDDLCARLAETGKNNSRKWRQDKFNEAFERVVTKGVAMSKRGVL